MSEKIKLNSHVLHPQIKSDHANAESAKLTNHDTAPSGATSTATAAPTSNSKSPMPTPAQKGFTGGLPGQNSTATSGSVASSLRAAFRGK